MSLIESQIFSDNGSLLFPKRDLIELPNLTCSFSFCANVGQSSKSTGYSSIQANELRNLHEEQLEMSLMQTVNSYYFNDSKKSFDNVVFDVFKVDPDLIAVSFLHLKIFILIIKKLIN